MKRIIKREKRYRRHKRVRARIIGTATVPRFCVFRSAKHIYAQLIDDEKGKTLLAANDKELKKSPRKVVLQPRGKKIKDKPSVAKAMEGKEGKMEKDQKPLSGKSAIAYEVGKLVAEKALKKKIEKVVFDRGGYKYHGRVEALAEGARSTGLKF